MENFINSMNLPPTEEVLHSQPPTTNLTSLPFRTSDCMDLTIVDQSVPCCWILVRVYYVIQHDVTTIV